MPSTGLEGTIINDSIHGSIQLDPLCVSIIDTPQFQRLRHLKQLGPVYYVYPGAPHNRFEHCIGVCHLAGKFVEILKANQPDYGIDDKDVLCVKVAGLCHDLGHGPFSHLFETVVNDFIPEHEGKKWKHEDASIQMLDHLIKNNKNVNKWFKATEPNEKKDKGDNKFIELDEIKDKKFIELLIKGKYTRAEYLKDCAQQEPEYDKDQDEDASIKMFKNLIKNNKNVEKWFKANELDEKKDKKFIELDEKKDKKLIDLLIKGNYTRAEYLKDCAQQDQKNVQDQRADYLEENLLYQIDEDVSDKTGRGPEKNFLYQIVANDKTGIDVDKWDYFARDCHMLGIKNNFDHERCMQLARVCEVDKNQPYICFRDKEQFNLYEMFHTRYTLHVRAYKHKTVTLIDEMILDALKAANAEYKKFPGEDGKSKTMSEAIEDMEAYTHLTDDVLYDIGRSTDKALKKSRQIIDRIARRQFYKLVDKKTYQEPKKGDEVKSEMIKKSDDELSKMKDDFKVSVVKFDYGQGMDNPMDNVYFYTKNDPKQGKKIPETSDILIPRKFCEWDIRVIYKKLDEEGENKVREAFAKVK